MDFKIADRGGWILDPIIGLHENVGELDFTSLFPNIMVKHNLSGETVNCSCCPNSTHLVPETGYRICLRRRGVVPKSIRIALVKRAKYKQLIRETDDQELRTRYKNRVAALKWILVTCFGYLGFRKAKFGHRDAHMATCAFSRDVLRKTVEISESSGFRVVHGIVDSIWVWREDARNEDYEELGEKIQRLLDFPVSFEGKYRWIVFLPSRQSLGRPVLNRYYGVFYDGEIKMRGIETRRHDIPALVRECQLSMIEELAKARDAAEFHRRIPVSLNILRKYVERVLLGDVDLEDLVITKQVSKLPDEYEHNVGQALASLQLKSLGLEVKPGQNVSYILLDSDHTSPRKRVLVNALLDEASGYDSAGYVELLVSSVETILEVFGLNRDRIYSELKDVLGLGNKILVPSTLLDA